MTPPAAADRSPAKNIGTAILGGSGLHQYGGFVYEELLSQLQGLNGVKYYREMADNDPMIGAMLAAITLLLRQVIWTAEPVDDSDRAKEAADFVKQVLFEDMSHPFSDFVTETLSFLTYGFSVCEIVYKIRGGPDTKDPKKKSKFDDKRIGIRKLAGRAQDSIFKWEFQDDGGVAGCVQQLYYQPGVGGGTTVFIPIEKMLLFRTTSAKNNPEGRSILRNAFVPYVRKQTIEQAEGRSAIRSAGVVQITAPSEYMSPSAGTDEKAVFAALQELGKGISQDRTGLAMMPSDRDDKGNAYFELSFVTTGDHKPADMSPIIERYDKRIVTTGLADFLLLGQQAVGSFALSSDKTQLFATSLKAYLGMISDVLQRILLVRLWDLNAFDPELMPKLTPGEIEKQSLVEVGAYIQNLASAGMPLFPDEKLDGKLRDIAGLPEADGTAKSNNPNINGEQPIDPNNSNNQPAGQESTPATAAAKEK